MYEQKMKENAASVIAFIEKLEQPRKREDAHRLLEIFEETTGYKAKMWGTSIIGFGSFHYRYKSEHEGDAPYVGFSPRKAKISLYLAPEDSDSKQLLKDFGKHTRGKSCVYINKLDDVNIDILRKMIKRAVIYTNELYPQEHGI